MWKSLDDFYVGQSAQRDVVESILEGALDKYKIDASDMTVKVPDLLLRECEKEIHRVVILIEKHFHITVILIFHIFDNIFDFYVITCEFVHSFKIGFNNNDIHVISEKRFCHRVVTVRLVDFSSIDS